LAELTDALCIVVSEERGTISVARDGKLREVQNIQELGAVLESFLQTKFPSSTQNNNIGLLLFRENWIAKAIAIALAIGFWYIFVPGSKTVEISYTVPVSVENLPPDLQVEEIEPPVINATFRGPRRAFYLFNSSRIKVAIDVSMAELGRRTFTISEKNIQYPKELTLQDISPSTLRLSVRKVPVANDTNRG
jgi:diadenylate cyclase